MIVERPINIRSRETLFVEEVPYVYQQLLPSPVDALIRKEFHCSYDLLLQAARNAGTAVWLIVNVYHSKFSGYNFGSTIPFCD